MNSEKPLRTPPVYTRTGDKGQTSLIGGQRVSKAHGRLDAYGTVDELNSVLGVVIATLMAELDQHHQGGTSCGASAGQNIKSERLADVCRALQTIQHELFHVGSRLACEDASLLSQLPVILPAQITRLETLMDTYTAELSPLKNFILPGGSLAAAHTHIARTVCRRAERICVSLAHSHGGGSMDDENETSNTRDASLLPVESVLIQYLNRLSDYLFVLSRYLNHLSSIAEPIWNPHAT